MNILLFIIVLFLIYLINPLKNEEKIITSPFISIFYIIGTSYLLSFLDIPMYKVLYLIPLILIIMLLVIKSKLNSNLFSFKLNLIKHLILIFILLCSMFIGYVIFPKYPCEKWDSQFHMYKIKAIIMEKNIFYKNQEYIRYWHYPSGFHSFTYFLASDVRDIPNTIYFIEVFIVMLFVLSHYYIGECIKKGIGIYTALFVPLNYEFYRILLKAIYPNALGYCIFLILIAFLLRYKSTKNNIYLYLFSFGVFSLIFTHTFPFLMLTLFLVSLMLWDVMYKEYIDISKYIKFFSISILCSLIIIYSKLINDIISYSNTSYVIHNINLITLYNVIIFILGGIGTCYFTTVAIALLFSHQLPFSLFIKCLLATITYIVLFIFGMIFLVKNKKGYFVFYGLLMILWILNNQLIGFKIPFFSALYNSIRWFYNFQILMPVFYGCGLYYISKIIPTKRKLIITAIIITLLSYNAYTTYSTHPKYYWKFYLVGSDEIDAFNFINENNISNELFLNFGQDSGQFIPIFTNNKCVFCWGNGNKFNNVTAKEIINYTWYNNYDEFIHFCKSNNISYVFISKNIKVNYEFFEDEDYFEKIYSKNNITVIEIK
ncbi:hypothetical protein JH146_0052 [Methanocaldococcus bathoardescens]|uniref:Glycosyltransferase RgtA/B/C/D-like domain-containing protein n=1 Tax=Methanocaldococcus bathoardescens TaxID=1301915 RepID=A0A076LEQ0_9EURY|nr:DUF6541 family protein [Methanocaldococcus bathoardescens]AIJ04903.1 hypothetical protein JH146_0052 [Methanocaldococcus bathoardescens]